jgi:hypothetical protein
LAEREGFEPSMGFLPYSLSRGAPSTTRPSLQSMVANCSRYFYAVNHFYFNIEIKCYKKLSSNIRADLIEMSTQSNVNTLVTLSKPPLSSIGSIILI